MLVPIAAPAQGPTIERGVSHSDTLDRLGLRARLEGAIALATPLVRDANGTRVMTGAAAVLGAALARDVSARSTLSAGVRVALSPLRFRDDEGARWGSGTAWQVDVVGSAERRVLGCGPGEGAGCTALRAGAGVTFLGGPSDVVPFRRSGSRWGLGGEAGAAVRLVGPWPLYGTATGQAYRLFGAPSFLAGPVRAGVVGRALVGVRYGR